jgi:ABC-2 type transport system permease protein
MSVNERNWSALDDTMQLPVIQAGSPPPLWPSLAPRTRPTTYYAPPPVDDDPPPPLPEPSPQAPSPPAAPAAATRGPSTHRTPRPSWSKAFFAILRRDLFVSGRDSWVTLIQMSITPLFMLFIFGRILSGQGYVRPHFVELLQPGIISLAAFMTGLQTVAMPLVLEFGFTKEIEDRLLAPLPTGLVAIEKLVIASLRGLVCAVLMYPLGWLVIGSAPWRPEGLPLMLLVLTLGAWVGGAIGMTLATLLPTNRINVTFSVILTPLIFTGCVQYPWSKLSFMPWFKWVTAFNPMTYVSEGMRAAVVPKVPHIDPSISALVLTALAGVFTITAVICFRRRATR